MSIDQLIVVSIAVLGIGGVYWFFLGKRSVAVKAAGDIEIVVDGGYTPDTIEIPVNVKTTIHFFRKDPSSCLEDVVLSDFGIRRALALNERTDIAITPKQTGTFRFSCGMGMYHGTVIVK